MAKSKTYHIVIEGGWFTKEHMHSIDALNRIYWDGSGWQRNIDVAFVFDNKRKAIKQSVKLKGSMRLCNVSLFGPKLKVVLNVQS